MHKWLFGLTVAVFVVVPAAAQDDATAIIKKAIEAHGGAKALDKYPAGAYSVKGQMNLAGSELDFTGDITYQLPDKYRMALNLDLGGQKIPVLQVVNGTKIKNQVGGQPQPLGEAEKNELMQATMMQEVSQLTPLLDSKKYTIKAEKDAKVGDQEANVVLVTAKDFKDTRLYFSKKTGLLIKTERKGLSPGMGESKEVLEESLLSDYKKVEGVEIPMKVVVNHDGKKFMEMTVTDAKLMEKADPMKFAIDD